MGSRGQAETLPLPRGILKEKGWFRGLDTDAGVSAILQDFLSSRC